MAGERDLRLLPSESDLPSCKLCPRLVAWREEVAATKRRAFIDDDYWAKPVASFGDPNADRLIIGLAPAAHGANRTGRMFTGDRSGQWLYRALWKAGVASQPTFENAEDGLQLIGVLITAIVRCAPPGNKPTPTEVSNCRRYFEPAVLGRNWRAFLCLGSMAWNELWRLKGIGARPQFQHGAVHRLGDGSPAITSYHPSQQNTFTRKLTEEMFDRAINLFLSS